MEKFKGYKIPEILKPDKLRICTEADDINDDEIVNCSNTTCSECVMNGENGNIAEEYLKTKGKYTPLNECFNKENNMNISDNILTVFEKSSEAKKVANRFGDQYGNSERDLLALRRDAKDLLAIIKDEEDEAKEAKKKK